MQVSAISRYDSIGYNLGASLPYYHNKPTEGCDTSFNSLAPYLMANKPEEQDDTEKLFRNINKWQTFCQDRVMGKKLNVIA